MPKHLLILGVSFVGVLSAQTNSFAGWHRFGESRPVDTPPVLNEFSLSAASWITIRVNEPLSSDHNRVGDAFTATLVQPLVANGIVIARRGQTVAGRVVEAQQAGRTKGTSRLGIEINEVSVADGQQIPVKTQWIERKGDTSVGLDAGAIGATVGAGAAIGAGVGGGVGAGVGAAAGVLLSTIGVLVTRGRATVVYPEDVLTFRLESPLLVLARYAAAFRPVTRQDYAQPVVYRRAPPPPPYYAGYSYPPYGWGPSLVFYSGPRFYGRRVYYRRW